MSKKSQASKKQVEKSTKKSGLPFKHEIKDMLTACGLNDNDMEQFHSLISAELERISADGKRETAFSEYVEVAEKFILSSPVHTRCAIFWLILILFKSRM